VTLSSILDPPGQPTAPHCASEGRVFIFPSPVPYATAWDLQSHLHTERVVDRRQDTVLILEHQPVYTLGRSTQRSHWGADEEALRANGAELYRVNRGGSVTYHGPGQILVYPILRLAQHAAGPRQLVRLLEEIAIRVLSLWNIDGYRIDKKPGVWVMAPEPAKIASIGLRVERGITLHGLALNVDLDLTPFLRIHPCGLTDCPMTSMAALRQATLPVDTIKRDIAQIFGAVFAVGWPTSTVEENSAERHTAAEETARMCTSID